MKRNAIARKYKTHISAYTVSLSQSLMFIFRFYFILTLFSIWFTDWKFKDVCCKKSSPARIRTEITSCIIQSKTDNCVSAVMWAEPQKHIFSLFGDSLFKMVHNTRFFLPRFRTNDNLYCSSPNARWVRQKIKELAQVRTLSVLPLVWFISE